MEEPDAVAVSLDELTIDLSGEQNETEEIASYKEDNNFNNYTTFFGQNEVNLESNTLDKYILDPLVSSYLVLFYVIIQMHLLVSIFYLLKKALTTTSA